jgi:hypothetical protein
MNLMGRNLTLQDQQQRISWKIQDLAWFGPKTIVEAQCHIGEPDKIKLGNCTAEDHCRKSSCFT